jgi:hypothetical protein
MQVAKWTWLARGKWGVELPNYGEEFIDGLAFPRVNTGCFAPVHGM